MKYSSEQKGFTLIELMIVIAIIGILAAIAIPSYLGIQKKAARSEAKALLPGIGLALESYYAETGAYCLPAAGITQFNQTYNTPAGILATTFNHPGNIAGITKMGTIVGDRIGMQYDYQISITQPTTSFIIRATPRADGKMAGDLRPWLRSDGAKGALNSAGVEVGGFD